MTQLQIKNLSFRYKLKKYIFKDFDLTFSDGITLLLGANGSGKSTMFKLIAGVLLPKSGEVTVHIDGQAITDLKSVISYIPQNFNVFPSLTVKEVLTYICQARSKGISKQETKQQVENALEIADIKEYADKKMRTLSGGTRQRVGIAQSVLGDPKIIIADEPTAGLDPEQRERYNRIVARTAQNRLFVISTHLFEDAEYYNNLVLIADGKVNFQGTKQQLVDSIEGKLYTLTCPEAEFDKKMLSEDFKIIDAIYENNTVTAKLFVKTESADVNGMKSEKANLRDAWKCYR